VKNKSSKTDLSLELNSVLYNLGAVMNNIGVHTPLEGDVIKSVSQKFQEAAWVFEYMKKTTDSLSPSSRSHDFTVENLLFHSTIQLAQSQYCFFKKAEAGGMSAAIMAKITYQLKTFFEEASNYCKASKVLAKGGYLTNTQFYVTYYEAIANYYKGVEIKEGAEEQGSGMGMAEGYLKYSMSLLDGAVTYDTRTKNALKDRIATVEAEYKKVKEINKNVYYEGCKDKKDLTKIESKNFTLHRSIETRLEAEYGGAENFEIFLPMEVRKLEGEFQQMANKIINQNFDVLQKLSSDEDIYLAKHGLPQAIYSLSSKEELPDDLWKRVSDFQQKGNFQYLENLLAGVKQNRKNCFDIVGKCEQLVIEEENDDNSMRTAYGSKWQRLQSSSLNGEIKSRIESYKGNLDKAYETDATVENNMDVIKPKMKLLQLSRNELTQQMPKASASKAESEPCVKKLEESIAELNNLKARRGELFSSMTSGLESAALRKDLFAVYQGNLDKKTAFNRHLDAFNAFEKEVEDQQMQSAEIMSSIEDNMSKFNKLRSKSSHDEKREFFASIDEGLKTYYENMNLLSNGSKFYKQMHQYLTSLHLYINDFVTSRAVEKEDIVGQLGGGGSSQGHGGYGGGGAPPGGMPGAPYNPGYY
jgi:hypothetical protein